MAKGTPTTETRRHGGIPAFDSRGAQFARFAFRGAMTRLALCFDSRERYTGAEVQNILLAAMKSIDGPLPLDQETPCLGDSVVGVEVVNG
jgi:hypothetical protein